MVVTEHRVRKVLCVCGKRCEATFPLQARAQTSYGPRVRATALYLMARQHIPFERTAEAMDDLLGVDCSTGFLDNLYSEGADGLEEFGEVVRDALRCSEVVHFDETPLKVNK